MIAPGRAQTNPNNQKSKFQTNKQSTCPVASSPANLGLRFDTTIVNVLVIEYFNLRFICNLVLEIWDFIIEPFGATGLEFSLKIP
jgi:hypothetical protein